MFCGGCYLLIQLIRTLGISTSRERLPKIINNTTNRRGRRFSRIRLKRRKRSLSVLTGTSRWSYFRALEKIKNPIRKYQLLPSGSCDMNQAGNADLPLRWMLPSYLNDQDAGYTSTASDRIRFPFQRFHSWTANEHLANGMTCLCSC